MASTLEFLPKVSQVNVNLKLAIKRMEILQLLTTWMELEALMLCEISQGEKDNYCTISFMCGI